MNTVSAPMTVTAPSRVRPWMQLREELVLLLVGLLAFVLFPQDLGLLTNMATMSIFALSLSLVLGQAGIATLGQAALYGSGAYVVGWTALHLTADPIVGLLLGGLGGGVIALLSGAVMLRSTKLTLVMLTIAVAQLLLELANWARWLTGGDDGLAGFNIGPLLGIWEFNFLSHTGYFYALGALVLVYFLLRNLVESPFGLTARAIRQDPGRVQALGGRVYLHLLAVYTVGGIVAGLAGALTAQTSKVANLFMLDFTTSAGVVVMIVLGGTRRLSGAVLGTVAYMTIHHIASTLNPYHWLFLIGSMLIVVLIVLPEGLIGLVDRAGMYTKRPGRSGVAR
ncbi:amino acid/amide ABC transporter membrane protein 2 (HAAT family) [Variovorax beijingensis]|uniref:Branched-chain amino acid transport system permease protein n=2 Tax=Variovorax TaxID=34072 RepID=A0AAE3Y409_VARPD|nr:MULTISPECIES: branched-chain amino acid ABC transporter permease [Variovorax]MDR6428961.1 branched-chain amino acid transport system permease protein [Variovorax paradoxus]MDR6455713.1 branched-chain amino acid transport system permease protein [Variovorax paradoxus]TWD77054.1 amino acid/amide ABC transporter membrane protein 2 (HAAT family) [Variovorax beijingensis]